MDVRWLSFIDRSWYTVAQGSAQAVWRACNPCWHFISNHDCFYQVRFFSAYLDKYPIKYPYGRHHTCEGQRLISSFIDHYWLFQEQKSSSCHYPLGDSNTLDHLPFSSPLSAASMRLLGAESDLVSWACLMTFYKIFLALPWGSTASYPEIDLLDL